MGNGALLVEKDITITSPRTQTVTIKCRVCQSEVAGKAIPGISHGKVGTHASSVGRCPGSGRIGDVLP